MADPLRCTSMVTGRHKKASITSVTGSWKTGDSCIAVYRPGQPDLATLQSASA